MHYALHYMPYDLAIRIVGVCTMFMLVAMLSGIVAHKKIFRDFFTFRPGKESRSWLDGHNLLGVSALPFFLMITWSGLILFVFTYMPLPLAALYSPGDVRDRAVAEAFGYAPERNAPGVAATVPLGPLEPLLADVERRWGDGKVSWVTVIDPGRANALVSFTGDVAEVGAYRPYLRFDGATGRLSASITESLTAPGRFRQGIVDLHEGRFAGPILRLLYVLAGIAGAAMIATGLLLWSAKRKAKAGPHGKPHFGVVAVDVLNLGTIIGLPVGIAAYFWANRLLPVGMEGRASWEVHSMFFIWGLTYIFAIWRPLSRAWPELCWLAAAACGWLPIVNALTTDRHLGASIAAGDWVFVGFDLSALAAGLFFALTARMAARKSGARGVVHQNQVEAAT